MSTDFNIKPVGAPVAAPVVQPVSEAAHQAVATELPAAQSVTVVDASVRARIDSDVAQLFGVASGGDRSRRARRSSIRSSTSRTSLVVQQFPDEAMLRRRAYFHTLDLTKGAPTRLLATDRKA